MEMTSSSPRNIQHQVIQEKESISNNTIAPSSSPTTPTQTPNKPQEITGNNNPYPTTFVQADTSNFKQVVQLLTGSSSSTTTANNNGSIPPIKSTPQKKQGFKLYERRNSLKNGFMMINTSAASAEQQQSHHNRYSPRELLSPSILDFPSLVLSPRKPPEKNFSCDESSSPDLILGQEEKAIAEKKFYLSPRTENVETTPQLLTLFPLTSPRVSGSSS